MPKLSGTVLEAALEGLLVRRAKLNDQITALRSMLGNRSTSQPNRDDTQPAGARKRRRRMSAEGRKRIAEAARKRWAAYNAQKRKAG